MPRAIDHAGKRYGRLVGVRKVKPRNKHTFWLWRCDCGVEKEISANHVKRGKTRSCGCLLDEYLHSEEHQAHCVNAAKSPRSHGLSRRPEYYVWKTMRQRCSNPNNKDYHHYGGRGISVCPEWEDFEVFWNDMGPANGLTIDRIDPNGGYCASNCRWADWSTQNLNKRDKPVVGSASQ